MGMGNCRIVSSSVGSHPGPLETSFPQSTRYVKKVTNMFLIFSINSSDTQEEGDGQVLIFTVSDLPRQKKQVGFSIGPTNS